MKNMEQRLLNQIKEGDEKAFGTLFYMHSGKLFALACKITQDATVSEDIVQDFFIHYWEKKETLVFHPSFLAYACQSIYHLSLNYLRDNERFVYGYDLTIDLLDDSDADGEDAQELQRLLMKAIDELPDRCKKIFVMATLEKKKYSEVADSLGISINTVKVQVSKAYRILKEKIG
jgi:RNA polymerase sigma-70 factor (ECF subfamily)